MIILKTKFKKNMNKKKIALSVLLLLAYSNCYPQSIKLFFAADVGINKFLNNPGNFKTGFSIGGKAGYIFSYTFISGIKVDYKSNSPSNIKTVEVSKTYIKGGQSIDLGIKAYFMYGNFSSNTFQNPYILVGAGVDMIKLAGGETEETGTFKGSGFKTNIGLDLAIGMGFKVMENTLVYIQPEFTGSFSGATSLKTSLSVKTGLMFSL